jgi:ribosomal protein S18 acetylase RimI-like enzyme
VPDFHSRPCEGASDLALIVEFAGHNLATRLPGLTCWHPGDIAWQLTGIPDEQLAANVRLWRDAEGVAGVAVFEPHLDVTIDTRAGLATPGPLLSVMLNWAEARRRELPPLAAADVPVAYRMLGERTLATELLDGDAASIASLRARGYERVERGGVRYRRSLEAPIPPPDLPGEMRLRHVTGTDLEERIDLHRDAWSVWGPSGANVPAYRKLRASPVYREELDVVLEAPDGRFLSYCIAWADEASGVGLFEPVGVRPASAGKGFGRAVIHEGMRRLKDMGMHTALIGTASVNERALRLYPSCGFELADRSHFYVKQLG